MSGPISFIVTLQKLYPFWHTAEQIQAIQEQRLRTLLRHAVAHSPFYRRKFSGIDIETCALSDLPTLTKAEMMENFDGTTLAATA
jgi:phenylacetate-CoA ligase